MPAMGRRLRERASSRAKAWRSPACPDQWKPVMSALAETPDRRAGLPLRTIGDLDEPLTKPEPCRTVASATVIWADYDLILRDFPHLHSIARVSSYSAGSPQERPDIDAWLLRHAAVVSEAQLQNNIANEPIPLAGPTRTSYRPPRYGRAAVIQLRDSPPEQQSSDACEEPAGLLDVKGCGVTADQVPSQAFHRTGLLALSEAFRELSLQMIIERLFQRLGLDVRGVGLYAVLDLGFRKTVEGGTFQRAGAIVRRAHRRPPMNKELPDYDSDEHRIKLRIEFILRRMGLTSSNPIGRFRIRREEGGLLRSYVGVHPKDFSPRALERLLRSLGLRAPVEFDVVNVQLVREARLTPLSAEIVDFGHYHAGDGRCTVPLVSFVKDRPLDWGGIIDEATMRLLDADPRLSVHLPTVGTMPTPPGVFEAVGLPPPAETTGLTVFSAGLARDYAAGYLQRAQVLARLQSYVRAATQRQDLEPDRRAIAFDHLSEPRETLLGTDHARRVTPQAVARGTTDIPL
jgi:hypothetical protein